MGFKSTASGAQSIDATQNYFGRKNFVFFSCHFPPRFRYFVHRLKQAGVNVLGIGDTPYDQLHFELKESLGEYYKVGNMDSYDFVFRAMGHFIHQHGRIHYFESFNEHWVELEGRIRRDFNIPGYLPEELEIYKRKSGMKRVFIDAGLNVSPGILPRDIEEAKKFAASKGYPFIIKPDKGVGALGAKKINDEAELIQYWKEDMFLEKFIFGEIETYDGFTGENGEIKFEAGIIYSAPIMDVLTGDCEQIFYYIRNKLPEDIVTMGRASVKAFNVKARFFHLEFFRSKSDGKLVPLEINLRPPGGITVDMWNYAYRQDIYQEYARMISGQPVTPVQPPFHYCVYAARRNIWRDEYIDSHEQVVAKLGKKLELVYEMPQVFSGVMGDTAFVFVCDTPEQMQEYINSVEDRRKKQ